MNYFSLFFLLAALISLSTPSLGLDCATTSAVDGSAAVLVYGQSSFTTSASSNTLSGLANPDTIAVDPITGALFVSDQLNSRVLRYPAGSTVADRFFGNPANPNVTQNTLSPAGLAFDATGNLYVSDQAANRVLVFRSAGSAPANSPNADVILGQPSTISSSSGSGANQLNFPEGLYYDTTRNRLFVCDSGNGRVVFFDSLSLATPLPNTAATGLIGQPAFGVTKTPLAAPTASNMNSPFGATVDAQGNLWVADFGYNRVTRYTLASYTGAVGTAVASNVLGQNSYTTSSSASITSNLNKPFSVTINTVDDTLYVSDPGNNRVVAYTLVNSGPNSDPTAVRSPNRVYGQSSISTGASQAVSATSLSTPSGVLYLQSTDALLVSDTGFNRVVRFCGPVPASPSPAGSPSVAASPAASRTVAASVAVVSPASTNAVVSRASSPSSNVSPLSPAVSASSNPNVADLCVRDGKGTTTFDRKFTNVCSFTFGGSVTQTTRTVFRRYGAVVKNFLCCAGVLKTRLTSFSYSWKGTVKNFRKLIKLCYKAGGDLTSRLRNGVTRYNCRSQ